MQTIAYSRDALKTLRRMPANMSKLIVSKIEQYAADPAALANKVEAYKSEPNALRLRVGDWRVIFSVRMEVMSVSKIGPRGDVYD